MREWLIIVAAIVLLNAMVVIGMVWQWYGS
jgi:hypothetical protein